MAKVDDEGTPGAGASEIRDALEALLKEHDGDRNSALRVLIQENQGLHGLLSDAEARLPADGSVVLSGDEAKAWKHYRELGEPADVRKAVAERDQFRAEAGTLRKKEVVREAATLHGFRPAVLEKLAAEVEVAVVDGKGKDGKPARLAVVREPGAKEGETVETPLADYAAARWADFLPSLQSEPQRAAPGTPPRRAPGPAPAGSGEAPDATVYRSLIGSGRYAI
jgi:hypothetical protein